MILNEVIIYWLMKWLIIFSVNQEMGMRSLDRHQYKSIRICRYDYAPQWKQKNHKIKTWPRNDLGVDRKLGFRAIDRRQARQKRSNVRSIHGHILIRIFWFLIVAHHHCGPFDALEYFSDEIKVCISYCIIRDGVGIDREWSCYSNEPQWEQSIPKA